MSILAYAYNPVTSPKDMTKVMCNLIQSVHIALSWLNSSMRLPKACGSGANLSNSVIISAKYNVVPPLHDGTLGQS